MEIQRVSLSWGRWSLLLLLLGLAVPPAAAQALSYQEAVLRAVDGFNKRSSEDSLYRLLELDQLPPGDDDPNTPKIVSFAVKETVCSKTTRRPPEQCNFKENGLVKQCIGTVFLDRDNGYFDISCDELQNVIFGDLGSRLGQLIQKGKQKIGRIIQRIKDFFSNIRPREEES
ncbi:cathelicidin antimicrobial peptide [Saccopteryx bilineata]|uniref:cathelicidin antimicrobial peptide n=1 Tax=Saccopteryx bilineata TaxID=59482 RepID=UPI00338FF4A2